MKLYMNHIFLSPCMYLQKKILREIYKIYDAIFDIPCIEIKMPGNFSAKLQECAQNPSYYKAKC